MGSSVSCLPPSSPAFCRCMAQPHRHSRAVRRAGISSPPATIAYVNADLKLVRVQSMSGILSPPVLVSFAALGLLPLGVRYLVGALHGRFGGGE